MKTFLGMQILVGIVQMPHYNAHWKDFTRTSLSIVSWCEQLWCSLYVVDDDALAHKEADKLAKIRPMFEAIRNQCVKVEPEEHHSVNEQIIPSKIKWIKVDQYSLKKPQKWGFKTLVRAGASRLIYDFNIYGGKEENTDPEYQSLQKCTANVARLYLNIVITTCSSTISSPPFLCFTSLRKWVF